MDDADTAHLKTGGSCPRLHLESMDLPVQGRRRKPTPGLLRATVVSSKGSPDLPMTLWKRKVGRDFRPFVAVFGQTFVMSAVESIRARRHEMDIKTYWMNVEGLEKTLAVLATLAPNLRLLDGCRTPLMPT